MWGTDTDINAFNDILRTKPEISLKKEIVNGKIEVGIISYNKVNFILVSLVYLKSLLKKLRSKCQRILIPTQITMMNG